MGKKRTATSNRPSVLRERAEQIASTSPTEITAMPGEDAQRLVHELEIHQIELELQNEELRKAHVELAESRDSYSDLYEFAPIGYVTLDKNGRILGSNLTAAKMLDVPRHVLLRNNIAKFITRDSQDGWFLHRNATFSAGTKQACEIEMRKAEGSPLPVRLESILFESHGAPHCRTAIVDITELKRAEKEREELLCREQAARREAEAANRAKDQFLAMVSHELRTPLTPILAWSRFLCGAKNDEASEARALQSIERNATLLSQLIEDLLDISGFMAGKVRLEVQPLDLAGIINAAVNVVRDEADRKSIQIETQFESDIRPVLGDSKRLQQVFWNLLANAVKFSGNGGRIRVRLERQESQIRISVSDTGKGIAADFLPHVFERFRQADETTAKRYGGLGLGLSIVRQIVELHKGTVDAASRGEGQGATFTVCLPIQNAASISGIGMQPRSAA